MRIYPYRFSSKDLPPAVAVDGMVELSRLVGEIFPGDALLTRGTDMHEPAEWGERLVELRAWERVGA